MSRIDVFHTVRLSSNLAARQRWTSGFALSVVGGAACKVQERGSEASVDLHDCDEIKVGERGCWVLQANAPDSLVSLTRAAVPRVLS